MRSWTLQIGGMHCASCVGRVEKCLLAVPGTQSATVNLVTGQARIQAEGQAPSPQAWADAVAAAGYQVLPPPPTQERSDGLREAALNITGMHCASCVSHVEKALQAVPGVTDATVNLATGQAHVRYTGGTILRTDLEQAVQAAGYQAALIEQDVTAGGAQAGDGRFPVDVVVPRTAPGRSLLILGAVISAALMMLMMWHDVRSHWIQLVLGTALQCSLGLPFYRRALRGLSHGRADMDVLVALGTSVAWGYSVVVTLLGAHLPVYFETAAMILTFIGLGRYLEERVRDRAADAIRGLQALQPAEAMKVVAGGTQRIPVSQVRPGDTVLVRPGDRVPVDGQVVTGTSQIDASLVTGESAPVPVVAGDAVFAGTVNQQGAIEVQATSGPGETLLAGIARMVVDAQTGKARVQRLVDQIAGIFVPVVLILAALTLLGWGLFGGQSGWMRGMLAMVAVLVVACPCALGLATPMAILVGTGLGARRGIVIRRAEALERAGRITAVVLDKTGTLTLGRPEVVALEAVPWSGIEAGAAAEAEETPSAEEPVRDPAASRWPEDPQTVLLWAAAVEGRSSHPLAGAIVRAAEATGQAIPPVAAFDGSAQGVVRGQVQGRVVCVGRLSTLREHQVVVSTEAVAVWDRLQTGRSQTLVAVAIDNHIAAVIGLADALRPEAPAAVSQLRRMGLSVILLTGDSAHAAAHVAEAVGITQVEAGVLPKRKQEKVAELRAAGAVVAMVGDGINDAPALAEADLGIAIGGGTDIAADAADLVLVGADLRNLPRAITLSRATMRRIHVGLFWAFAYNLALLPVAAAGKLNPMLAGAAMAFSSVSVVINALWLRRKWRG